MTSTIASNGSIVSKNLLNSTGIGNLGSSEGDSELDPLAHSDHSLVIIDSRTLDRECFARSIAAHKVGMEVLAFDTIETYRKQRAQHSPLSAILLNVGSKKITDPGVGDEISGLASEFSAPVIVLAETDELTQILKALEFGARGYIPSSVGIDVCIEAIGLALAGGIFVPASSVLAMRQLIDSGGEVARPMAGMFTARQAEVVEALRRGKANKIIAYELNLRESTVKVHIRNIMKKLKATNRTEVAYKINDLFPAESQTSTFHGSGAWHR